MVQIVSHNWIGRTQNIDRKMRNQTKKVIAKATRWEFASKPSERPMHS